MTSRKRHNSTSSSESARRTRRPASRKSRRQRLLETLEPRQLLAGPQLIGIQPNEGVLIPLTGQRVEFNVSPRELVFHFDDSSEIDPLTIADGIQITRAGADGGFESASVTTDLGTSGQILLEFVSRRTGGQTHSPRRAGMLYSVS